jgi:sulfide dehydrogenase cytochrome subunit
MPIKIFRTGTVLGFSLVIMSGAAGAADSQALYTQSLAATCANCHGTQGKSLKDPSVPGLAGRPSAYLIEQMQAFKTGTREATIMHQIAKGYTDEQVKQMADYFANQKP